jgi:hypothetical protein
MKVTSVHGTKLTCWTVGSMSAVEEILLQKSKIGRLQKSREN